jgi:DNA-binding NtrC family response regulator
LQAYDFPGNVRELRNIIERALIECGERVIQARHLRFMSRAAPLLPPAAGARRPVSAAALPLNLAEAEEVLIQRALQETGGNIADAARLLGVHRTRIYRNLAREETRPVRG